MRHLYISLFLCLVVGKVFSQAGADKVTANSSSRVIIRCQAPAKGKGPLWVVDGILVDARFVEKIDPNDVESIDILKENYAASLYGSGASDGVIVITTKTAGERQFQVKDLLGGSGVTGATLTFISLKNGRDSLRFAADEQGLVKTSLLKFGEEYKVVISSVGYKTLSATYKNKYPVGVNRFLLERAVKENEAAVVIGYSSTHRCGIGCGCFVIVTYSAADSMMSKTFPAQIYPNPITRGSAVKVEINVQEEKALQIRITNLNGAVLRSMAYRSFKGINRIELSTGSQWTAGIYFVQVLSGKGELLKQDKLILQ